MLLARSQGDLTPAYYAPLEVVGLYWSFVDTVWIFLFPASIWWGAHESAREHEAALLYVIAWLVLLLLTG